MVEFSVPRVRAAATRDLEAVNAIVTDAVLAWPMAERLKRIALRVLRYDGHDFDDMQMLVAEFGEQPAGVAVWDAETAYRSRTGRRGALLHGLYVRPQMQRAGIGTTLQCHVAEAAALRGFEGLIVKSERVSVEYFEHCGYARLSEDGVDGLQYPYLFWRGLTAFS
ncbi:MAG: GNAT family N-acetyltransferase [Gammaproteobacteria bacterium]|nr:GNAT family N-acetyltransferase [Gammaproteobacteria bacterium]